MSRVRIFRYCVWSQILLAERAGWKVVEVGPSHHSVYSVLVEWLCDCEPASWSEIEASSTSLARPEPIKEALREAKNPRKPIVADSFQRVLVDESKG